MSDMVDDELLGGEDELDDVYDITQEREDDLLQDEDDEYPKGRRDFYKSKKDSDAESEDLSDVLNLDVEEDLQDEDKLLYEDEEEPPKKDKMTVENTQHSAKPVVQITKTVTLDKNQGSPMKKFNTVISTVDSQKGNNFKKNNNWKKRGNGRGNFQPRSNFPSNNNNMQRRRNGTVLINPRYEGTVHVNENNARLKWDNPQYLQSNYVPPWNSGNLGTNCDVNLQNQLLSVVSGIANSLVQTPPTNLLPPQPLMQNFYEPSRTTNYEQPLAFEPPPSIVEEQHSQHAYGDVQNQVPTQQLHPPGPPPFFSKEIQQRPYNNQMSANVGVGNQPYNAYNNYNNYSHSNAQPNMKPNKVVNRTNSYENRYENTNRSFYNPTYTGQNNYQNTSVNYVTDDHQNKNSNYSDYNTNQGNYANSNNNKFNYKSNQKTNKQTNQNVNYRQDSQQKQPFNFKRTITNNLSQQNVLSNDSNRSSAFVQVQKNNANVQNQNPNKQGNRRAALDDRSEMKDLSEKRARFNQDNRSVNSEKEEKKNTDEKPTTPVKQNTVKAAAAAPGGEVEEDEETRQYRLKIEEQKRERERILAIKEERRRQMLLEKQKHEAEKLPEVQIKRPIPPKPVIKTPLFTKKHKLEQQQQSAGTVPVQTITQHVFNVQDLNPVQKPSQFSAPPPPRDFNQQAAVAFPREFHRETQVAPPPSLDIPNMTFKISNDLQADAPKTEASSSSFMSNRVVVVKGRGGQAGELTCSSDMSVTASGAPGSNAAASDADAGEGVSSFFNSRKVLKKDNNLLNTRLVVVNNLSANINQSKLVALSRGIGEIQNLRVDNRERQATILFKSVASAHAFFTKYQRRILDDLSVIEVTLQPMV